MFHTGSCFYETTMYLKENILFMQIKYIPQPAKPFDLWSILLKAMLENILSLQKQMTD